MADSVGTATSGGGLFDAFMADLGTETSAASEAKTDNYQSPNEVLAELLGGGLDKAPPQPGDSDPEDLSVMDEAPDGASDPEDADAEVDEPAKPRTRAQKRIQQEIERRKAAENATQQMQAQFQQQIQQQNYQMQQALQQQEQRYQMLQYQLQQQQTQRSEQESEKDLTAPEQFERQLMRKQEQLTARQLAAIQQKYDGELQALRAEKVREVEAAKARARQDAFMAEATQLRRDVLFKDYLPEDSEKLGSTGEELILTRAAAYGEKPLEAAIALKKYIEQAAIALNRAAREKAKTSVAKSQAAPRLGGTSSVATSANSAGIPDVSRKDYLAAGYKNYLDGFNDNFRKVKSSR